MLLVLGTGNRKKAAELVALLGPLGFELKTLADFSEAIEVVEDGDSFAANAARKASQQARHLGQWVLGEDSGLAVDALDGAPGIFSARYSGPDADDEKNNRHLLAELGDLAIEQRTAHYICHATVCDPSGEVRAEAEARCNGRIRFEAAGAAGFGYDPLFEIVEYHRTVAELGDAVKACFSHRARAIGQLIPQLIRLKP
ncbi:MAG: RdgB/HAM1 family non-canonical purine NTP pyrophosphatase [Planctomycetes bacterium]|nr:RdgB/HAM1 family non-canonical purine NTP pyrophosphatase [Planctomycetota bacterium]